MLKLCSLKFYRHLDNLEALLQPTITFSFLSYDNPSCHISRCLWLCQKLNHFIWRYPCFTRRISFKPFVTIIAPNGPIDIPNYPTDHLTRKSNLKNFLDKNEHQVLLPPCLLVLVHVVVVVVVLVLFPIFLLIHHHHLLLPLTSSQVHAPIQLPLLTLFHFLLFSFFPVFLLFFFFYLFLRSSSSNFQIPFLFLFSSSCICILALVRMCLNCL